MELPTVVLADFANEEEYDAIKNTQGVGKSSLRMHKKLIEEAVQQFRKQGYRVAIEICDFEGYKEFCITQKALNTPQTVAAYVEMKHRGVEKQFQPGLDHQNITKVVEPAEGVIYGVYDEDDEDMEIYAAYKTLDEVGGLPYIEMVENYIWAMSDWTDPETGVNYIGIDALADEFACLCRATGLKKSEIAKLCGISQSALNGYLSGAVAVPQEIWERVQEFRKD